MQTDFEKATHSTPLLQRFAALGLIVCLAGCRGVESAPEPMESPKLPSAFGGTDGGIPTESPGVANSASYAEIFKDPQLALLIDEALNRNHDLGAAAARVLASAALWKGAQAAFRPTIDGSAGATRSKQVFVGFPIPGSSGPLTSYSTSFDAGLSAAWEPDFWGRLSAGERAAEAALGAQAEEWQAARLSIAANVSKGWYSLLSARLQSDQAREAVATWRSSLDESEARRSAGVGTALDVALLESRLASAEADLAGRMEAQDQAARSLEILLGRYPAGELAGPPGVLPEIPLVEAGLPAELLARRPDLRAAEWRVKSLRAEWDVAEADRYPRLTLTGSLGQTSDALEDLLDGDFSVWSMAARLVGPLWDGGRRAAVREGVAAQIQAAEYEFVGGVLVACAEVENSLAAEGHLAVKEQALVAARDASQRAKDLVQARRDQGLVPISEVLEAERSRIGAESQWLAVRHERVIRRIELIAALGGGMPARKPATLEPEGGREEQAALDFESR